MSLFQLLKDAVGNKQHDFTALSIRRSIALLAIPMILEMAMESLFAVVDAYFVGRLGAAPLAAVATTESVLTLIYALAIGMTIAATAMVARRTGEKDIAGASRVAMQSIYMVVAVAIVVGLAGGVFAEEILRAVRASDEVVEVGVAYARWMYGGNVVIMLIFLINGIFRGVGNAAIAMRVLWISNGLNMILDPLLIFGIGPFPELGVEGAAIATNIGRGTGVLVQLYYLFGGKSILVMDRSALVVRFAVIRKLFTVSLGGAGQFIIGSASWIVLMNIMGLFGQEAQAGYMLGIRLILFTLLPAWGMANAASTLVGQNLGAARPDRAEEAVWKAAFYNMIFLGGVSLIYFLGANWFMGIFTDDALVLRYGVECLQWICAGYVFFAYGMVIGQSFNGAGDTKTPTKLNFLGFWVVQIPLAYGMAIHLEMGPKGVFLAIALAQTFLAVVNVLVFRQGKWKETSI